MNFPLLLVSLQHKSFFGYFPWKNSVCVEGVPRDFKTLIMLVRPTRTFWVKVEMFGESKKNSLK